MTDYSLFVDELFSHLKLYKDQDLRADYYAKMREEASQYFLKLYLTGEISLLLTWAN